jgi:hypothetical protein
VQRLAAGLSALPRAWDSRQLAFALIAEPVIMVDEQRLLCREAYAEGY